MHSIHSDINSDDVIVLYPDGRLYFSLTKDTYEKFGIQGLTRSKDDIKHDKYMIEIDLAAPSFKPINKAYERLKWCVENTLTHKFTFVCCAVDKVTGETLAVEWPTSYVTEIIKKEMKAEYETLTDINIPTLEAMAYPITQKPQEDEWSDQALEALEWIGLAQLKAKRIKVNDKVDPFVSVYRSPSPFLSDNRGTIVRWKGLIPAQFIQNILILTRKLMVTGIATQWTSLSVWGYKNSPFTWDKKQHYAYINGENDYTVLLMPKVNTAYCYKLYGSHHIKK
ncbi:ribonuclease P [Pilobolus umbonatus]|nr:ribonuclease P [Pilobolus umbonatus]